MRDIDGCDEQPICLMGEMGDKGYDPCYFSVQQNTAAFGDWFSITMAKIPFGGYALCVGNYYLTHDSVVHLA